MIRKKSRGSVENILITGGAGFIGSHLTRRLLKSGARVTVLDNLYTGRRCNLQAFESDPRFCFIEHDVTEPFDGDYTVIYNLACPASPPHYQKDPIKTLMTSFLGMKHTLELALRNGARVFHASTSEVYGSPPPEVHPQPETYWGHVNPIGIRSCYDEGKRAAEALAADYRRIHGLDIRLARIFNTYGPQMDPEDGRVVSNFIVQALAGKPITLYGDGEQTRSFQFVSDLIDALMRYMALPQTAIDAFFARKNLPLPVLNLGNPGEYTIGELAKEVCRQISPTLPLVNKPLPSDDPGRRRPDITLARELLGWTPQVSLPDGLALTIPYFKSLSNTDSGS